MFLRRLKQIHKTDIQTTLLLIVRYDMQRLQRILKKHGPMLSGRLGEKIANEEGIGLEAARQRLCRTGRPIRKITLGYKNNQSFVYLEDQFNSDKYWNAIKASLKKSSKAYYALLN